MADIFLQKGLGRGFHPKRLRRNGSKAAEQGNKPQKHPTDSDATKCATRRQAARQTAATLVSLMAAFGGHITSLELPAQ